MFTPRMFRKLRNFYLIFGLMLSALSTAILYATLVTTDSGWFLVPLVLSASVFVWHFVYLYRKLEFYDELVELADTLPERD